MSESTPEPVQTPQIPQLVQPVKRKWWKMSSETKQMIGEVKYLIGTFVVLCLTQLLQPLLQEIMESEMKATWKTWSSIVIPAGLGIIIAIIMKIVQGKRQYHPEQQQYGQMPQQYAQQGQQYIQQGAQYGQGLINQGATMGTNLINQGGQQLQGVIQTGVQAIPQVPQSAPVPVATPTPTPSPAPTEPKVETIT